MFSEYQTVKANKQIGGKIPIGTIGTILIIYEGHPQMYEIEFIDQYGDSIEIVMVEEKDIDNYDTPQDNFR